MILMFGAQVAYEGVRAGRKLHLTDMATHENRAAWTALSNTLIGLVIAAFGGIGLLIDPVGPGPVLLIFALMSLLGAGVALRLQEVQRQAS